jgi:hypothetical protein
MNGRKLVILFQLFTLLISLRVIAQESELDQIKKNGFKVIKEDTGRVVIDAKNLALGQRIMFVRFIKELDEFETISQGSVKNSNGKLSLVQLDTDKIEKFPKSGDYAVPLGEPIDFMLPPSPKAPEGFVPQVETAEILEKGYFDLGYSMYQGSFATTSTNRVDSFKKMPSYPLSGVHFMWHPDFAPNYGFGYRSMNGNIPLYDYYEVRQPTTAKRTQIELSYRNKLGPSRIRWKLYLLSDTMEFATANNDEYVISSKQTGLALGGLIGYELSDSLPLSALPGYGHPLGFYLEAAMTPNLTVSDSGSVVRGASSAGSTALNYSVKYSHVFYWDFIPWFKRYFFDIKYSMSEAQIKFQGATKNDSINFYVVPENGSYTEKETLISISFGLRMDDWLGRSLKPREK